MVFRLRVVLLAATIFFSYSLLGQTSLPLTTIVTQNFNSIGTSGTATLPANWRMSPTGNAVGAWSAGVSTTTQAASSGTPSTGGRYNWATTAGTDRAIGFLSDGSYNTPTAVMAYYRNTTGATVNSFTIAFAIERYVVNTGSFSLTFESSTDGTTWTPQVGGSIAAGVFASGANAGTFTSPQTVYKTLTISATVANNADIYFRWIFNTTNSASQGLGLDNVSVFAGTATPVLTAKLRDILQVDNGTQNQFNIGDDIRYQTVIKNIGTADALNVQINIPPPANTTLVPGSIKTSSVARDDSYTTGFDAPLNVSTVPTGVLNNDFGVPSPAVVSFGPTANAAATAAAGTGSSDNGGTVTLNANGTFTYTPATGFSGIDKFAYIAANGNLPNNEGIVTITVGAAATVANDAYNVIGNVSIVPNATQGVLNNDAGGGLFVSSVNGSAANVGAAITTVNGGNLTVNANGSFTYNPAKGYEGSDNFTYTANNGIGTASTTATVTLTVAGMIWFIDGSAAAGGDGRRSTPFNNIASFQAINIGGAGNADVNDYIYVFENAAQYNGSFSLLNGQRLIGQDATIALGGAGSITGYTVPAYSTALPVNNSANGTRAIIGTSVASTNAINLVAAASNTLRGFRLGNTTGFGINSTGFGTLTVLEVDKNGTGGALNLSNGALAATFVELTSTSSAAQGINLAGITGSLTVTNGTTISGTTTQGILVGTTTATINFGNTTVTSATDGVSFQNNSSGAKTFGTLSITHNGAATGFLHGAGGGPVTAGVTTISNTGGTGIGIDIQNSNADLSFGATTVTKTGAGTGVNIATSGAGNDVTFASLDITTANGAGLVGTNNTGQIIVTANSGDINATNGAAINLSQAAGTSTVNLNFAAVTSSGAANGITLTRIAGTIDINGGTLTGTATGATFNVSLGSATISYDGNITQNAANRVVNIDGTTAGTVTFATGTITGAATSTGVNINNAVGNVTFANLNLGTSGSRMTAVPVTITGGTGTYNLGVVSIYSTGVTAVSSTNADGTINITSGTVDAATGAAFSITGPVGLTTLGIGVTANSTGGTNNVNFTNCTGSATLGAGAMSGATAASFNVVGCSAFSTTYNGTITQSNNAAMINVNAHASGTLTFNTGLLNATNGTGLQFDNADGTYNFNGNITLNGGDAGVDIINGSNGTFSFTNAAITNPTGIAFNVNGGNGAITHAGAISKTSAGRVIEIQNKTGGTVAFSGAVSGTVSSTGLNLVTNTGATVNFTGLLTLNGTASVFSATGGGTVTATNAGNTIGNTTAPTTTALTITGTTIGAGGVVFTKVSCTGGVNGILLSGTGTGPFTITGDAGSVKNASGGTITGTSGAGISITGAANILLDQMTIQNGLNDGVFGSTVNNFSLTNSTVSNNGDALNEHGIDFTNVTGTVRFTNCTFSNNEHEQVHVVNDAVGSSADYEFNAIGISSTGLAAAPNGSHGITATTFNSASMDVRVLNNSTFDNLFSNSIMVTNEGTGTLETIIANTSFTNVGAGAINIAQNNSGPLRFYVHDNPTFLRGSNTGASHSINVNQAGGVPAGAVLEGQINNNTIGSNASSTAGNSGGDGIRVLSIGSGITTVKINNNAIQGVGNNGINVQMSEDANAAHAMNATIFSNTVTVTDVNSFDGIRVVAGAQSTDVGTLKADINNNVASSATGNDFTVRPRFGTVLQLLNYAGGATDQAAVQNYLDNTKGNNPTGPANDWFLTPQGAGVFGNTASVPQPTLPTPTF